MQRPHGSAQELRQRFTTKPENPSDTKDGPHLKDLLGILSDEMKTLVTEDIKSLIQKDMRLPLNGYIFCLSRIMRHELAWECISQAYAAMNEKVPSKFKPFFGQVSEQTLSSNKLKAVK